MDFPNFFIVGAAKGGTTSLYEYLKQHPDVFMSLPKEPHFFSQLNPCQAHAAQCIPDENEYRSLFMGAEDYKCVGEASTSYLWEKDTAERIRSRVPHAKIVIVLRNPIDRAYSHYLMDVRDGVQSRSFHDAIMQDYNTAEKGYFRSHLYVELGLYYEQVKRYISFFGKKQVLVISFSELTMNTLPTLQRLSQFLDIDFQPFQEVGTNKAYNAYSGPRNHFIGLLVSEPLRRQIIRRIIPGFGRKFLKRLLFSTNKPSMDVRTRAFLDKIYNTDMRQLQDLIGWAPYNFDA